jgi:hypothetical protein
MRAAFEPEARSRWTPDERFLATPNGYLVEVRAGRAEALPVGRPVASDDSRTVAVVDAEGTVSVRATTAGAATRVVAADAFGLEIEPGRARSMVVRGRCATQLVRLDVPQSAIELGPVATSRVVWTERVAAWASEHALHTVELATLAHHQIELATRLAETDSSTAEDGPPVVAEGALAAAPDLVAVLTEGGRLEVRGDQLGAPRWSRADVASFAASAEGAEVAVVLPPRDGQPQDLRVRVLAAKDGAVKATRDLGPHEVAFDTRRGRFVGVCGGGAFRAIAVKGTVVTLQRECSLVDLYVYDVAKDLIVHEEHHTPEEDAQDGGRLAALCARTRTKDCPRDPFPTWIVPKRVAAVSSETATHLFDVVKQRRIGTLDLVAEAGALRGSPRGAFVVVDASGGANEPIDTVVWDAATARRVWSAPRAP